MSRTIRSTTPTSRAAIPEGQYGAGTVETWDRGSWAPLGDPEAGMRKGDLQFVLHGQRLQGRFHLVRLKRRERERQDAWFLIKGHDEHERPGVDALTLEAEIPFRPPEQAAAEQAAETPPAPGAVRGAAAEHAGGAALRHRRGAAGGRGLDQRDQVRRLPDAGLDRARHGAAGDPQRP